ncbi:hypothetical protein ACSQ67_013289 [Phaseolus vulgaris]
MATGSGGGSGTDSGGTFHFLQRVQTVPPDNAGSLVVVVGVVQRVLLLSLPSILVPGAAGASGGAGDNPGGEAQEAAVQSGAGGSAVGIRYGQSSFTVMYRGIPLGKATVPGFFQQPHSTRQVIATIAVDRVNLLQADAADLIRDASLNDRVDLRVLGDVAAKIRVMNFDSPAVQHMGWECSHSSSSLFTLSFLGFCCFGGLCYCDQSQKAISVLQAVWIRWIDCLIISFLLALSISLSSTQFLTASSFLRLI